MSRKPLRPNKLLRIAHRHGLPVRVFVETAVERFGSPEAAALQVQVPVAELLRYTTGAAQFTSRLVELADARGMDLRPFAVAVVQQHGRAVDAARALDVDVRCLYLQLWKAGVAMQKRVPAPTRARLLQLLSNGVSAADTARLTGVPYASVYYYSRKLQRMTARAKRYADVTAKRNAA